MKNDGNNMSIVKNLLTCSRAEAKLPKNQMILTELLSQANLLSPDDEVKVTNEKLKLTFMEAMKQNWQIGLFFHLSIYNDEIMQLNLKSESILKAIKEERTQAIAKVYKEGAPNYLLARCDAGMCANQAE